MHKRHISTILHVTALLIILLSASISAAAAQESKSTADRLTIRDQTVGPDGVIVIEEVVASLPGWVVLHRAVAGIPGPIVGIGPVSAGITDNATAILDLSVTADTLLFAVLYTDEGEIDVFDYLSADVPVRNDGKLVAVRFVVTPVETAEEATEPVSEETPAGSEETTETEPEAAIEPEAKPEVDTEDTAVETGEGTAPSRRTAIVAANSRRYLAGSRYSGDGQSGERDPNDHRTTYKHDDFRNSPSMREDQRACRPGTQAPPTW